MTRRNACVTLSRAAALGVLVVAFETTARHPRDVAEYRYEALGGGSSSGAAGGSVGGGGGGGEDGGGSTSRGRGAS